MPLCLKLDWISKISLLDSSRKTEGDSACRVRQEEPAILISRLLLRMRRMFGQPLRKNGMHRRQFDHARLDFLSLIIWSRVQTICHVKLAQSTTMEQKRFDIRSLSTALRIRNLWLLLVLLVIHGLLKSFEHWFTLCYFCFPLML